MKPYVYILLILSALLIGAWYFTPDTELQFGSDSGAKTTGTVEAAGSWTNCTTVRLNTSDNSRTELLDGAENSWCQLSDYNFGIPAGATIDGIAVNIESLCTTGTCNYAAALSWDNGSTWTSSKTDSAGTSDATDTLGGATDTWGRTWSAAELADGTFQARITATSIPFEAGYDVDFLSITAYYTEAPAASTNGTIKVQSATVKVDGGTVKVN